MTDRVREGLGLPAGLYRLNTDAPTVFVPNGITADGIESIVYANVVPVSGGLYDWVAYDSNADVFVPVGSPQSSPTHFNDEAASFLDDVMRQIFNAAQIAEDFPYKIVPSETRANVVNDLATLKADFVFNP